ncbi:MAG: YihY/virulence factor BrkB family protein [Cytophagaceae bacterium]|nr:YihY/virulence factor BrkB family protein [Cytophagaceae bacterium]MDW8456229.1 YihY/virulence factor BrkB family protein [Cytophagaceae bacterium]
MKKIEQLIQQNTLYQRIIRWSKRVSFTKKKVKLYTFTVILFREIENDLLIERSRAMAFSFMLSVFPALLFLFSLIPFIPIPNLESRILAYMYSILPESIYHQAESTIREIVSIPRKGLLSVGFLLTIYSASNGVMAMKNAFNRCHTTVDRRPFIKRMIMSFVIIFIVSLIVIVGIGANVIVELYLRANDYHKTLIGDFFVYMKNAFVFLILYVAVSIIYYIAPALHTRWSFFSHGSFFATLLIAAFTWIFAYYVDNFNSYNKVYGSIGTLIALMLWFYGVSFMLLLGYEINACIDLANEPYYRKKLDH